MRHIAWIAIVALAGAACAATPAVEPAPPTPSTWIAGSEPTPAGSGSTSTTPRPPEVSSTMEVPPVDDPPVWPGGGQAEWDSRTIGLPSDAHVEVAHGPLGFVLVRYRSDGTAVWMSKDGIEWGERAAIAGPVGEEQVDLAALVVTQREYVAVGTTWSNAPGADGGYRAVLWRSQNGSVWRVEALAEVTEPGFQAETLIDHPNGLIMVGGVFDDASGAARGAIWKQNESGAWKPLAESAAFDQAEWVVGGRPMGRGMIAWGLGDRGRGFIWRSSDLATWTLEELPPGAGHPTDVVAIDRRWVLLTDQGTWIRDGDAGPWRPGASPGSFATDAVSPGWVSFRWAGLIDVYLVTLAQVGDHWGAAWCYADPASCGGSIPVILISPDGVNWRKIRLPEADRPDHPIEPRAMVVDGKVVVVHSGTGGALLSTLSELGGAEAINSQGDPGLPFEVAESGAQLRVGVRYGHRIWTHCGFPILGPFNDIYWRPVTGSLPRSGGEIILGFVRLVDDETLEYLFDNEVIATYAADPGASPEPCF